MRPAQPALVLIAGLGLLLLSPDLVAQTGHQHGPARRTITAPRLERAPVIDGRFSQAEWAGAIRLEGFSQQEPIEGAPATEATEVYLGRDANTLFIAFIAWDRAMGQVQAVHSARDQLQAAPDRVGLWLDPRRTGSRAFVLQFNPLGVQYDGIWSRRWDTDWDGVLASSGSVATDHYVVEVALPIATLVSGSAPDRWDINFSRVIGRRGEESWWAPVARADRTALLGAFAVLDGMETTVAGPSAEVLPTLVTSTTGLTGARRWDGEGGVTARMSLGTVARLDATVNPDFSFVEADAPQSSFNERWALFYPEKRPFFQEGADQFGTPGTGYVSAPLRLVHTRTIAQPRQGLRLTLNPAGGFLGALYTRQDRFGGGRDGGTAVVRALRQWPGSSRAGLTFTHRDLPGRRWSMVGAADAQLRSGRHLTITAQVAASRAADTLGHERGAVAGYLDLVRDDGRSFQEFVIRRIPAAFAADAGFVPRRDLQQVVGHLGWFWRPGHPVLQWVNPMVQVVQSWDGQGRFTDREWLPHLEVQGAQDTNLWLGYRVREEHFRGADHASRRMEARLRSRPTPWLGLGGGVRAGRWLRYDTQMEVEDRSAVVAFREAHASAELRLGPGGSLAGTLLYRSFGAAAALPAHDVWAVQARLGWQFNNAASVRLLGQYDPDLRRWAGSLLLGYALDFGTQFQVGLERGGVTGDRGFVRVAYRLRVQ